MLEVLDEKSLQIVCLLFEDQRGGTMYTLSTDTKADKGGETVHCIVCALHKKRDLRIHIGITYNLKMEVIMYLLDVFVKSEYNKDPRPSWRGYVQTETFEGARKGIRKIIREGENFLEV